MSNDSRPSTETLPPSYNADRLPGYTPPAPRPNPRFAKHDQALDDLYGRCAEEQAALEAAQVASNEYLAKQQSQGAAQPIIQPMAESSKKNLNPLERWVQWSAKYYAPNLYRDSKK